MQRYIIRRSKRRRRDEDEEENSDESSEDTIEEEDPFDQVDIESIHSLHAYLTSEVEELTERARNPCADKSPRRLTLTPNIITTLHLSHTRPALSTSP